MSDVNLCRNKKNRLIVITDVTLWMYVLPGRQPGLGAAGSLSHKSAGRRET